MQFPLEKALVTMSREHRFEECRPSRSPRVLCENPSAPISIRSTRLCRRFNRIPGPRTRGIDDLDASTDSPAFRTRPVGCLPNKSVGVRSRVWPPTWSPNGPSLLRESLRFPPAFGPAQTRICRRRNGGATWAFAPYCRRSCDLDTSPTSSSGVPEIERLQHTNEIDWFGGCGS